MPRSGAREPRPAPPRADSSGGPSAADRKHLDAGQVRGPGAAEIRVPVVARAPHRPNPRLQLGIVGTRSKRGPQVRPARREEAGEQLALGREPRAGAGSTCLLYTSDAADDLTRVDLG